MSPPRSWGLGPGAILARSLRGGRIHVPQLPCAASVRVGRDPAELRAASSSHCRRMITVSRAPELQGAPSSPYPPCRNAGVPTLVALAVPVVAALVPGPDVVPRWCRSPVGFLVVFLVGFLVVPGPSWIPGGAGARLGSWLGPWWCRGSVWFPGDTGAGEGGWVCAGSWLRQLSFLFQVR